ncbi:MAG: hypothetical protein LBB72_01545 [Spirochaetaceae bacterium]|jgi:hypothetical protein|nr:hypothetical protein [Spirochaetaceae bacterium]
MKGFYDYIDLIIKDGTVERWEAEKRRSQQLEAKKKAYRKLDRKIKEWKKVTEIVEEMYPNACKRA